MTVDTPSPAFVREVIIPTSEEVVLRVPKSMIGQRIEFLVLPMADEDPIAELGTPGARPPEPPEVRLSPEELLKRTQHLASNSGGYRFDRDEANDYE